MSAETAIVRPPRARVGALVAIVNPSLALPGADPLAALAGGVRGLMAAGFQVRVMPSVGARWTPPDHPDGPVLAGSDAARADDLNAALRDPDVRLLLGAWGGGGADRLLTPGRIDWAALRRDPKLLCGFSDFGHLALAAVSQAGVVSLDGPSGMQWAAGPDEPMLARAVAIMTDVSAPGRLVSEPTWYQSQLPPATPGLPSPRARAGGWRWLRGGRASGRLVASLPGIYRRLWRLGQAPTLTGAIWCLDTYRDTPEQVATWVADLAAGGALAGLAGVVLARPWTGREQAVAVETAVLAATAGLQPAPPVLADADTGHTWPKWTLPNGVLATLDSADDRLSLDEPAVT